MTPADVEYADRLYDFGLISTGHPDCHECTHGASYRLNPDVVPQFLIDALEGVQVVGPEAGYPQLCRVWDHVDWDDVMAQCGGMLRPEVDLALGPWAEAWEACKMLRAHGYDATLDTALFVRGVDTLRLDPLALTVVGELPDDLAERVNRSIYGALNEGQARGIYYSTPLISEHDYENATQWHFSY